MALTNYFIFFQNFSSEAFNSVLFFLSKDIIGYSNHKADDYDPDQDIFNHLRSGGVSCNRYYSCFLTSLRNFMSDINAEDILYEEE